MPTECKEYPHDFYARKFSVIVVERINDRQPENFEEYAETVNMRLNFIETLAFFLSKIDASAIKNTDPTNLKAHVDAAAFLIMSFASSLHLDGDLERFLKDFE